MSAPPRLMKSACTRAAPCVPTSTSASCTAATSARNPSWPKTRDMQRTFALLPASPSPLLLTTQRGDGTQRLHRLTSSASFVNCRAPFLAFARLAKSTAYGAAALVAAALVASCLYTPLTSHAERR